MWRRGSTTAELKGVPATFATTYLGTGDLLGDRGSVLLRGKLTRLCGHDIYGLGALKR